MSDETISELIRRRLRDLGMTKSDLAKRLRVSRTYIGALTNATAKTPSGVYRPRQAIVAGLAKHLKTTEAEIQLFTLTAIAVIMVYQNTAVRRLTTASASMFAATFTRTALKVFGRF